MIVAEELDVPWRQVRVVQAPLDPRFGGQFTGGSTGVSENWDSAPARRGGCPLCTPVTPPPRAGAWSASACRTDQGVVVHSRDRPAPVVRRARRRRRVHPGPRAGPAQAGRRTSARSARACLTSTPRRSRVEPSGTASTSFDPGWSSQRSSHAPFGSRIAAVDETQARAVPGVRRGGPHRPARQPHRASRGRCRHRRQHVGCVRGEPSVEGHVDRSGRRRRAPPRSRPRFAPGSISQVNAFAMMATWTPPSGRPRKRSMSSTRFRSSRTCRWSL